MKTNFLTEPQKQFFAEFEKLSGQSFEDAIPRITRELYRYHYVMKALENQERALNLKELAGYGTEVAEAVSAEARKHLFEYISDQKIDSSGLITRLKTVYEDETAKIQDKRARHVLKKHSYIDNIVSETIESLELENSQINNTEGFEKIQKTVSLLTSGQGSTGNIFDDLIGKEVRNTLTEVIKLLCKENKPDADLQPLLTALDRSFLSPKQLRLEVEQESARQQALAEKAARKSAQKKAVPHAPREEPKIDVLEFIKNPPRGEIASIDIYKTIGLLQEEIQYAQDHKLGVLIQPHVVAKALFHATGIEAHSGEHDPVHDADAKKLTRLFNNGHSKEELLANCGILVCAAGAIDTKTAATYIRDRVLVGSVDGNPVEAALSEKVMRDSLSNLGKIHGEILKQIESKSRF